MIHDMIGDMLQSLLDGDIIRCIRMVFQWGILALPVDCHKENLPSREIKYLIDLLNLF